MSFNGSGSEIMENNKQKTGQDFSVGLTRGVNKKVVKIIISERKQELKTFKYNIFKMLR
jgi:hypothetical protein